MLGRRVVQTQRYLQLERLEALPVFSKRRPRQLQLYWMQPDRFSGTAYLERALASLPRPRCPLIAVTPTVRTAVQDYVGTLTKMLGATERDVHWDSMQTQNGEK